MSDIHRTCNKYTGDRVEYTWIKPGILMYFKCGYPGYVYTGIVITAYNHDPYPKPIKPRGFAQQPNP